MDERVKVMNEIIAGMRVIKMYTWEDSFSKWIGQIRKYVHLMMLVIIIIIIIIILYNNNNNNNNNNNKRFMRRPPMTLKSDFLEGPLKSKNTTGKWLSN